MAKVIMVQGTMSNAGKSIIAAGLCRVFRQDGWRVAPFKSQNMALNSFVTEEGLEIGRAQAVQAEAAGVKPSVYMNPILLKPNSDTGSQVIINGKPVGNMPAAEYFSYKKELKPVILSAFHELEKMADIIVAEGAGSPAEINLKENDIVNMGLAEMLDAPVLLVGDIDRGGVFAQLLGTLMLLEPEEKKRVKGMVINKFRGDISLLEPGIRMIEEKCGVPVTGTVPYMKLHIDDEDSLSERLENHGSKAAGMIFEAGITENAASGKVYIAVIRLPHISNFSDFTVLELDRRVSLKYISSPEETDGQDMIIIPGSKNTVNDLLWMRETGMEAAVISFACGGGVVFGICGGFQMLGTKISDPYGVETIRGAENVREAVTAVETVREAVTVTEAITETAAEAVPETITGMSLLDIRTELTTGKLTRQIECTAGTLEGALAPLSGMKLQGYEIHMGRSFHGDGKEAGIIEQSGLSPDSGTENADTPRKRLNVYGSYLHGIFDAPGVAETLVSALEIRKANANEALTSENDRTIIAKHGDHMDLRQFKEAEYDRLAAVLRKSLDIKSIYEMMGLNMDQCPSYKM